MPAWSSAGHNDCVARRIRWLLAFFLRAEPRGAAPTGWALAFDAVVAVGAAAYAVREAARRTIMALILGAPGTPGRPGLPVYVPVRKAGELLLTTPIPVHTQIGVLAAAAMTALPLAFRRYYPISVWLVIAAAIILVDSISRQTIALDTVTAHTAFVPRVALGTAIYAAYSAIAHSRYRNLAVAAVAIVTVVVTAALGGVISIQFPTWLTPVIAILPTAAAGLGIRELRRRLADSAAKLRRTAAEAHATTKAALAAERSRIAAELHDVVTHNVSVMIVQAGAARKILSSSPADAEDALLAVEATGREAMMELRNLLGLLSPRADGSDGADGGQAAADSAAFTPQPGFDELDTLIGRVSAAGLPIELRVTGEPRPLPPGADLAAYRVVQEGLTNILRHAGKATATVAIDWGEDLVITVTDDGGPEPGAAGAGRADGTPGRGLLGLRERLALYGGTLAAGPRPGGWQLRAVMPAPERSAP
jgi:signal transduction histidine kinase